jgi:hypothetical protein
MKKQKMLQKDNRFSKWIHLLAMGIKGDLRLNSSTGVGLSIDPALMIT